MKRLWLVAALTLIAHGAIAEDKLRIGYFPNLTHATALVGLRQGAFARAIGTSTTIEPHVFNAGPAAIEALLAGELDLLYVGPGPAVTGFVRSKGRALRVVAGVASGGASLVVRGDAKIDSAKDLSAHKLASPQIGNTQDVALRTYIKANGLETHERGGTVTVVPVTNSDIVTLFHKGEIDGAWVPEPWATILRHEPGAKELVDERTLWPGHSFPTTVLVVSSKLLKDHPEVVEKWLAGQIQTSAWMKAHPAEARTEVNAALRELTTREIAPEVLDEAWKRLEFGEDLSEEAIAKGAKDAQALGYLPSSDIKGLIESTPLQHARAAARR